MKRNLFLIARQDNDWLPFIDRNLQHRMEFAYYWACKRIGMMVPDTSDLKWDAPIDFRPKSKGKTHAAFSWTYSHLYNSNWHRDLYTPAMSLWKARWAFRKAELSQSLGRPYFECAKYLFRAAAYLAPSELYDQGDRERRNKKVIDWVTTFMWGAGFEPPLSEIDEEDIELSEFSKRFDLQNWERIKSEALMHGILNASDLRYFSFKYHQVEKRLKEVCGTANECPYPPEMLLET
jgi:hypothetical protein